MQCAGLFINFAAMYQQLHAIVLRVVRHSDTRLIVTAYTKEAGRLAFAVADSSTPAGRRRRAMLMPLALVECVGDLRPGREIHRLRDLRLSEPLADIRMNPAKSAVAMLLADVLAAALREPQPDGLLYDFLASSILRLDASTLGVANFHLCFLIRLQALLGIEPDLSGYRSGRVLDMAGGTLVDRAYVAMPAGDVLSEADTVVAMALSRMNWRNMHLFRFNRDQRNAILDVILKYYTLHDVTMTSLRSLATLRQLF